VASSPLFDPIIAIIMRGYGSRNTTIFVVLLNVVETLNNTANIVVLRLPYPRLIIAIMRVADFGNTVSWVVTSPLCDSMLV
jgi:hypothetical protein